MVSGTGSHDGVVAAVTGAGGQIGRAICSEMARRGAKIAALDLDLGASRATARVVKRRFGVATAAFEIDVLNSRSIASAIESTKSELGDAGVLVNNAGVLTLSPMLDLPESDWDRVMDVNAKGVFLCSKLFAREMIKRRIHGSIVNISSIAGKIPLQYQAHYCASKAAVIAITKVSALELAIHKIRVNAVCPGAVDTKMFSSVVEYEAKAEKRTYRDIEQEILGKIGIRRLIKPEEIGRVVAFLCSEEAGVITGQAINVDGGNTAVNY